MNIIVYYENEIVVSSKNFMNGMCSDEQAT